MSKIKFFLYVRKSMDEAGRQVTSLESQENELRAFAKREGVFIYEKLEEAKTAKQPGRPVFNRMLDRIEAGEANGLLCWDIDRLYRNPIDEGRVRWCLQKGVIASIRTTSRQFFPEDAGLLMGVEGGRATDYIIRLKKNVKRGVDEKLRRGEWPGAKALGYVYDERIRNIVPDPERFKIVETIFKEYSEGRHSLLSVSARLAGLGVMSRSGKPWSKWSVWQFLTNKIYIGIMQWDGETFEGRYKTFISPQLFSQVQEILKDRSKPRKVRQGHAFPFCGLFRCTCGSMITAQWAKGHGGLYRYYRCTRKGGGCTEKYLQEKDVTKQCLEALRPFALLPVEAEAVYAEIERQAATDAVSLGNEVKAIDARISPLQLKLDRLTHAYIDTLIDEDSYRRAKDDILVQRTELKKEKERLQRTRASYWIEPAKEVIKALEIAGKPNLSESLPEISRLVQKIGTNRQISRKTVSFSISETYAGIPILLGNLHRETCPTSSPSGEQKSESPVWCPRQDLNLYDVTH
jgi:site-specific DNA recombinase